MHNQDGTRLSLKEDDVSKAPSVDIHFKSIAMVNEINKELLIHFSIK